MTYFCTGCWIRDHGVGGSPPPHKHREGCYERHRILGERLAPELVARDGSHPCAWKDCKDGGQWSAARSPVPGTDDGGAA